ncbi:MAG: rhomboid family intramembrane serine protease [Arenicellales bacterium]|nr:rhomboid family intramembrane serine protease [Arenicellales bacterium]MDP6671952.1 rhomboid family intramembrane serine protease [Arenicellales bacterium]
MALNLKTLPPVTTALISVSALVALLSGLGANLDLLLGLFISSTLHGGLHEIQSGEIWRLFTPAFIHFGVLHFVFNMLWIWNLGTVIESLLGSSRLIILTLGIGIFSNLAQYYWSGPAFGGMSGILYGLLGYLWIQGRFNPGFGVILNRSIVIMMLVWFVLCWTGLLGPIANMAHTAGLATGIILGLIHVFGPYQRS